MFFYSWGSFQEVPAKFLLVSFGFAYASNPVKVKGGVGSYGKVGDDFNVIVADVIC